MDTYVLTGEIQFGKPVLGIIFKRGGNFWTTDEMLGNPDTIYPTTFTRGLETLPDVLSWSADMKNVYFEVGVTWSVDNIRIIVAH